jgi:hypothetical protein
MTRYVSLTDLVVLVLVGVVLLLPPREVTAGPADRLDPDAKLALAFAEARVELRPDDGAAVADVSRRLGEARHYDWAAQAAAVGAEHASKSPTRWRALLAASIAYTDRLEVKEALEFANRTLASCAEVGDVACPSWEEVRVELYQRHLDAGVRSGIDPRKNPRAFREAGEAALRPVRAIGNGTTRGGAPAPGVAPGSAQGTSPP